jgi:hypothetical protein
VIESKFAAGATAVLARLPWRAETGFGPRRYKWECSSPSGEKGRCTGLASPGERKSKAKWVRPCSRYFHRVEPGFEWFATIIEQCALVIRDFVAGVGMVV